MRGSGGTEGGTMQFWVGFILTALALYLFFDSVRVATAPFGWISGMMGGRGRGLGQTTSMGILFVPFILGTLALFYDARLKWAWALTGFGLLVLVIEILSRIRFLLDTKTTHLLGMFVLMTAGGALMLRSFRGKPAPWDEEPGKREADTPPGDADAGK